MHFLRIPILESITLIAQTERVSQVLAPASLNLLNFYWELLQLLLQEDDRAAERIQLNIEDSGRGIPTADQARIFEPFYRGSNIDAIPGFGLGLAIVLRCVNLQQGEIFFASTVDVGTTFIVKLRTQLP